MTIDEAILHVREEAKKHAKLTTFFENLKDYGNPKSSIKSSAEKYLSCSKKYEQIAKWLEELKAFKQTRCICDGKKCCDCDDGAYEKGFQDALTSNGIIIHTEQIRTDAIDECKQILLDAMARDGKTKCHEYMIAIKEMEQLKENSND